MTDSTLPTARLHNVMTEWRHAFHALPELGFQERCTSARIAELLESFGVEVHAGLGGTGVVGVLRRGRSGRAIGIRADMDALPIQEANDFAHRSRNAGCMHACGHDGHTTMLLGAAQYLAGQGSFEGTVVFIFQPNEEHGLGAAAMIEAGLFERFPVDEVYALHNMPGMPVGSFATRPGTITASESLFEIAIHGRGGHAALPHLGVDAILVGSQIVQSLQSIVARRLDPVLNGVVSVTEFVTDGKRNVLAGHATLRGDARALSPAVNDTIEARMRAIVAGVALAHGAEATVSYDTIFPAVVNAASAVAAATAAARSIAPAERVEGHCEARLFSEDFAHMATARPGCFVLIGNGTQGQHARALHSADYDFNDDALVHGSSLWARLVEQRLPA